MMRLDPALCFLTKCGPPDNAAVQVRIQKTETCSWVRFGESDNPFCKGKVRTELVFCEIVGHNNLSPPLHYTATSQGLRPLGYTVQTRSFYFYNQIFLREGYLLDIDEDIILILLNIP